VAATPLPGYLNLAPNRFTINQGGAVVLGKTTVPQKLFQT